MTKKALSLKAFFWGNSMSNIDFSRLFKTMNHLKDGFMTENIIDYIQAAKLISEAIQELQGSQEKMSDLEEELRRNLIESARFKEELDREKALMSEILKQAPTGIVIAEAPSGKAMRANKMAKMIMGLDNVLSRSLEDHKPRGTFIFFHLDGTPYEFEEMPLVRSVLHAEVVTDEELIYVRKDGEKGVLNISSGPIFDREGKVIAAVGTFYEVAKNRQREKQRSTPLVMVKES